MNFGALWAAGWALGSYIANKVKGSISTQDLVDMIEAVNNWVGRALQAQFEYGGQELGAVRFSAQYARQIGKDMEQIEGYQQARWNRLLYTILPNSLGHAVGYVYSDGVIPLRHSVAQLNESLLLLQQQVSAIVDWEQTVAKPELARLLQFMDDFYKGDQPALNVLNDWLSHPAHFGEWAAAPITGPLIGYLADDEHRVSRDNFSDVLAGAWAETPNTVWDDFTEMLVS